MVGLHASLLPTESGGCILAAHLMPLKWMTFAEERAASGRISESTAHSLADWTTAWQNPGSFDSPTGVVAVLACDAGPGGELPGKRYSQGQVLP